MTRPKIHTYTILDVENKVSASYGYIDWTGSSRMTDTVKGIDYTFETGRDIIKQYKPS